MGPFRMNGFCEKMKINEVLIEAVHILQSDQKVKVNSSSQEGRSARVG